MARSRFHSILRERVEEEIKNRSISIASGECVDLAAYKHNVGYIAGLKAALDIGDNIEKEMD